MESPATTEAAPATATAAGGAVTRLLDRIGERANPILVRLVRQELRSRAFIGVFTVLLVAAMIASVVVGGFSESSEEGSAARGLFLVLTWAWSFALVLVQPTTAFRTVSTERNEDTWDLVELTGMRPRLVLAGLLAAAAVQGVLYTSALAPFMLMAYLLRGLDLASIIACLVLVPMAGLAASSLAVFAACLGNNKATRALMGSLLSLGLAIAWMCGCGAFSGAIARFGSVIDIATWDLQAWTFLGAWLNLWLAFIVACLVLAGSLLTFRAANRSTGPRRLWYGLWLNGLLWFIGISYLSPGPRLAESLSVFSIVGIIWSMMLGMFSLSEDYELSPRQARAVAGAERVFFAPVFGPGAARGRWAYLGLATLSLAAGAIAWCLDQARPDVLRCLVTSWALYCYAAIVFALCDRLYRGPLRGLFPTPPLRRGMIILSMAIVSLVPTLVLLLIDSQLIEHSALAALSPINGVILFWDDVSTSAGTYLILSVLGLAAVAVLARQGARLAVSTQRVLARENERNPRGG